MFQVNHQIPPDTQHTAWITWLEGAEIYRMHGRSRSTFNRDRLNIRQQPQPNGIRLYSREDIERIALQKKREDAPISARRLTPVVSGKATPEDMPELAELIRDVFEMDTLPDVAHWQSLMRKNSDIGVLIREGTTSEPRRVVGCGFMFPHTEGWVQHLLDSEITPRTSVENILPYEPGTPMHLYLRTVGITPEVSKVQKRFWAAILIRRLIYTIEELGRQGILIEKLWSKSHTRDGIAILQHMGFTQIESRTTYNNYVIDVASSGLPMILRYKRAYQEWQRRNSGEAD